MIIWRIPVETIRRAFLKIAVRIAMKLKQIDFVDIDKSGEGYRYVYAVYARSFMKDVFLKFIFRSRIPHYVWSDIQRVMRHKGIFFEDIVKGKPTDLDIGSITYESFEDADIVRYGRNVPGWKNLLNIAVDKQFALQDAYVAEYGEPDTKMSVIP